MRIQVPGKIFIAGEYGALRGFSTLSVAVAPHFIFDSNSIEEFQFHPESPAGRLPGGSQLRGQFLDPYQSTGGMGRSTAEFAIKSVMQEWRESSSKLQTGTDFTLRDPTPIWQSYRKVHAFESTPPSGVDLVTQIMGGYCLTKWSEGQFEKRNWPFANLDWVVLLTGYKVKTHQHLSSLTTSLPWLEIEKVNEAIVRAFRSEDKDSFVDHLNQWRELLYQSRLEVQTTTEMVEALLEVPGVLAVKGCGALGSDAVFVLYEKKEVEIIEKVLQVWNPKQVVRSNQVSYQGLKVDYEDLQLSTL